MYMHFCFFVLFWINLFYPIICVIFKYSFFIGYFVVSNSTNIFCLKQNCQCFLNNK